MNEIDKLLGEEKAGMARVTAVRGKIKEYWRAKHKEDYGVEPGVIVATKGGQMAKVETVEGKLFSGKPWVTARREKKDGTYSKRVSNLFSDWSIK